MELKRKIQANRQIIDMLTDTFNVSVNKVYQAFNYEHDDEVADKIRQASLDLGAILYQEVKNRDVTTTEIENQVINNDLTVYDINGKAVYKEILRNNNNPINLSHLPKGVYLVSVDVSSKKINKKIIIN